MSKWSAEESEEWTTLRIRYIVYKETSETQPRTANKMIQLFFMHPAEIELLQAQVRPSDECPKDSTSTVCR